MTSVLSDEWLTRLRWLIAAAFTGLFAYYIAMTWRWAIVADEAAMHYVVFLIHHGKLPYSEIGDMNMPGTYLAEQTAMAVFGWGDLSWRVYEFLLLAFMTASAIVIAGPRRWVGAIYGSLFFILMHASEGPHVSVEREEVMAVLLVAAIAALALAVRKRMPLLALLFGLLAGYAATIKPTAVLADVALLALLCIELRRQRIPLLRYVLWTIAGNAAVFALMLGYLAHYHAIRAFIFELQKVLPVYAAVTPHTFGYMLQNLIPTGLLPLLLFGIVAAALRKQRMGCEQWMLLIGAAFGLASYFIQGKGYLHHRYSFVVFLMLWVGVELAGAITRIDKPSRLIGALGLVAIFLYAVPHYVRAIDRNARRMQHIDNVAITPGLELTTYLDRDLTSLGADRLQGRVVCLDLLNSCLNGLYRLRLVENTSFTGDMLLFSRTEGPLVTYYRNLFMQLQQTNPADVVVLGNEWFLNGKPSFQKLDTWPLYKEYLFANYDRVIERRVSDDPDAPAYQLYLRKDSAILAYEQAHPLR
ncbi:MAG TPA: hypothetical protein VIJ79_12905 [Acidobacteriaceae bacterium]